MPNKLFSYNDDIRKNAYMNWRTEKDDQIHNMYVLANDFSNSAETLIEAILTDNSDKKADALIMPILYSIDQSIELYLKAIIRCFETLNEMPTQNYVSHDIESLKNTMVSKIESSENKPQELQKHLNGLIDYIDELYGKIKVKDDNGRLKVRMDFARYPIDTDGNPYFYIIDSENVVIDVENLKEIFAGIRISLEGLYLMYKYREDDLVAE